MKSKQSIIINKIFWTISFIGFLYFLFFMPKSIMYSGETWVDYFYMILIFIALPGLVFITINSYGNYLKYGILFAAFSPLLIGPSFGVWHNYDKDKELEEFGIECIAYVEELDYKYKTGVPHWFVKCIYTVKEEEFDFVFKEKISISRNDPPYKIGESVKLKCHKQFPKMYEFETKYDKKYKKKNK